MLRGCYQSSCLQHAFSCSDFKTQLPNCPFTIDLADPCLEGATSLISLFHIHISKLSSQTMTFTRRSLLQPRAYGAPLVFLFTARFIMFRFQNSASKQDFHKAFDLLAPCVGGATSLPVHSTFSRVQIPKLSFQTRLSQGV